MGANKTQNEIDKRVNNKLEKKHHHHQQQQITINRSISNNNK